MVGIPASIVEKSGELTPEEQWFMQRHSEIGERILAATPALAAVAPIVRSIHERPDGMGYPDGLTLEQIPLASRVIAVVEAFDRMTHDQPYQRAPRRRRSPSSGATPGRSSTAPSSTPSRPRSRGGTGASSPRPPWPAPPTRRSARR
jgi:hypothetical protein